MPYRNIGFKIINLDCVISRRGITIQFPPSILAKLISSKPINMDIVPQGRPDLKIIPK